MLTIGTVCLKVAGRDAGHVAVIIDVLDAKTVLVDGQVRRRKCNISHLEPTSKTVDVKKGASHDEVVNALKGLGVEVTERKTKTQKPGKPGAKAPTAKAAVKAKTPAPKVAKK
ncbi:50S ribosomal protein L14e [Candidatus Woesearchaeota archaeon]|nr:50S ribosomal protein L14e [Candidatus Woesearchaeota archaeon]